MTLSASKVKKIDTSVPMEIGIAAGTDGEEAFEDGYGKASELAVQAVHKGTRGQAYRSTSTAERVKKERIVLERDSGPRLEARKEEKDKRKVAKVTLEFAGAVGKLDHCNKLHQGELKQESERCGRRPRGHQRGSA